MIRPAVSADLDAVAHISFDGWRSTGLATASGDDLAGLRERIDRELAGGWSLFVAIVDATIVGMLALKPDRLDQLFVTPAFQRRGIGVALLREAQRRLPTGFVLRTGVKNIGARRFYERRADTGADRSASDQQYIRRLLSAGAHSGVAGPDHATRYLFNVIL